MKHGKLVAAFAIGALAASLLTARLTSQETPMPQIGAPGDEHAQLSELEGEFDMRISMVPVPGAPAIESKASARHEMILGGRFLLMTSEGTMMGYPVETHGLFGFDRRKGEFVQVGADTLGTYFVTASGKKDEETGVIVMNGVDESPEGRQVYRFEVEIKSADEMISRVVFEEMGGLKFDGGHTMVETVYTRRK